MRKYISTTLEVYDKSGILELALTAGKRARVVKHDGGGPEAERLQLELHQQRSLMKQMPDPPVNTWDIKLVKELNEKIGILEASIKTKTAKSNITSWHEGNYVLFDFDELDKEVTYFKRFGSLMAVPGQPKPLIEVRLNLLVARHFAYQVKALLSPDWVNKFTAVYAKLRQECTHTGEDKNSEQFKPQELEERHFVSSQARKSATDFFVECIASFACKESLDAFKSISPDFYKTACELFLAPQKVLPPDRSATLAQIRSARNIVVTSIESLMSEKH